jgi:hypothetical protein
VGVTVGVEVFVAVFVGVLVGVGVETTGLSAIKIPPFRVATDSVAAPAPVAPAVAFVAHAAPTESEVLTVLYSWVRLPGDVVVHPDQVGVPFAAIPNIITAALASTVVIVVAATAVELAADTSIAPGVTSKGPVTVSTPEKATIAPTPSEVPAPAVNV